MANEYILKPMLLDETYRSGNQALLNIYETTNQSLVEVIENITKAKESAEHIDHVAGQLVNVYNNVAEMKQSTRLKVGMAAKTLGYYSANDGGGAYYVIREKVESDINDGGSIHELASGLIAELIVDEVFYYFNPQSYTLVNSDTTNTIMGECNIIKVAGKIIMIDAGGDNRSASINNFLNEIGISKVDYLIISHHHYDHVSNLYNNKLTNIDFSDCVCYMPMRITSDCGTSSMYQEQEKCINWANSNCKTVIFPNEGDILNITDSFKIKFYNCGQDIFEEFYKEATDYNLLSLVAVVIHNDNKIVYSGDIGGSSYKRLLQFEDLQNVSLYKINHHGLNPDTNLAFYSMLNPKKVVVQSPFHITSGEKKIDTSLAFFTNCPIYAPELKPAIFMSTGNGVSVISSETPIFSNKRNYSAQIDGVKTEDDLNNYLSPGVYTIVSGSQAETLKNIPYGFQGNGRLTVIQNTTNWSKYGCDTEEDIKKNQSAFHGAQYLQDFNGTGLDYKRIIMTGADGEIVFKDWICLNSSVGTKYLSQEDDLNEYLTLGSYNIESNIVLATLKNTPLTEGIATFIGACVLVITPGKSRSMIIQKLIPSNADTASTLGSGRFYYRVISITDNIYSPWRRITTDSDFPATIDINGYQRLPSGLCIQWGRVENTDLSISKDITFPISFKSSCFSVTVTAVSANNPTYASAGNISNTGFTVATADNRYGISWIAIGK